MLKKIKEFILRAVEEHVIAAIAVVEHDLKNYMDSSIGDLQGQIDDHIKDPTRVTQQHLNNHAEALDKQIEAVGKQVQDQVGHLVEEKLAGLQTVGHRHVACPVCGKSFALQALNIPYGTRAITITCDNCHNTFEVRPSQFWNKIEVERR